MKTGRMVILVLATALFIATIWCVIDPPTTTMPKRTVAVTYHGKHAAYELPAELKGDAKVFYVIVGWMFAIQGIPAWKVVFKKS
jgi:hypothetical protein